ncbi:hypothetical protein DFJ43DRAFT_995579 [Lentinula guzmanii]|uniref:GSKIP domain-containing protein n=1 Tax=Lentinula guzmanii TaxID=2804957 RepID=A0AA38JI97_9AGAR|nr:hypothetical protein DFJ43DRAFT_995579 [Lentinula guzmanii]
MSPSEFYIKELQRALSEQALFIRAFSVTSSSSLQAIVSVTLLEGNNVTIILTNQGYRADQSGATPFETIEDLLQSVSPLYVQKRQLALLDALEKWSSHQLPNKGQG